MLIDRIVQERVSRGRMLSADIMSRSKVFYLDRSALDVVEDIIKNEGSRKLITQSQHLFWPSSQTWLEWRSASGVEFGVFFGSGNLGNISDNIHSGSLIGFMQDPPREVIHLGGWSNLGMQTNNPLWMRTISAQFAQENLSKTLTPEELKFAFHKLPLEVADNRYYHNIRDLILGSLALINTRRAVTISHTSMDRLNKSREKKGKLPLHSYDTVRMNLALPRRIKATAEYNTNVAGDEPKGKRVYHEVSAHLRLRLGKVELVHPHWRGDPSKGVKMTKRHVSYKPKS